VAGTPEQILAASGLLSAIYGEAGAAAQATGNAQALETEAAGTQQEVQEYGIAGGISSENAQMATLSGQLQQYQNTRSLMNTLGSQAAGISGNGFQESGTALNLARSSLQQGLLQNQVLGLNAQMESGGYLEEAASSQAEATAASTAAATESSEAGSAQNLATLSTQEEQQATQFFNEVAQQSGINTGTGPNGLPTVNPQQTAPLQPGMVRPGGVEPGMGGNGVIEI
jgi:hypothetical protein